MSLFGKKGENNKVPQKSFNKAGLSELNEDILINVAGGQSYHNEADKKANEELIKSLANQNS